MWFFMPFWVVYSFEERSYIAKEIKRECLLFCKESDLYALIGLCEVQVRKLCFIENKCKPSSVIYLVRVKICRIIGNPCCNKSHFFLNFTRQRLLRRFSPINSSSGQSPFLVFFFCKQYALLIVENKRFYANAVVGVW